MIKINLLRNIGGLGTAEGAGAPALSVDSFKSGALRFFIIICFPILFYGFEKFNLYEIQGQVDEAQKKLDTLRAERAKFGDAAPRIKQYNEQKQKIDKNLEVIRELARNRLREVKALDAIQSVMPEKTWARVIAFSGNSVRFEGVSASDDGPTQMMKSLEANVLFSHVEPSATTTEQLATGSVKNFKINFVVGKAE
jgi:Tfp pilus assembly protein PilN